MREVELELSIGDIFECGDYQFTVIDVEDSNVSLKVTPLSKEAEAQLAGQSGHSIPLHVASRYDLLPR